jgi:hypothetical protein
MALTRRQGEEPGRALSAFVIAVEEFHHEEGALLDVFLEPAVIRIRGVVDRCLPEPDVARGHVEVRSCGRNVSGSEASVASSVDLGLTCHPCRTAVPLPTFRKDIAR